jgi:phage protein D
MKPAFSISSGGADITGHFNDRLLDLKLTVHAGHENDELTLNLDDRDFAIAAPPTGEQLGVSLGYDETGLVFMGVFIVDTVEVRGPPFTMQIRAKAADTKSAQKQHRTLKYEKKKLGDIVQEIAGRHGLKPAISQTLSSIQYDYLHQNEESDWHILTRLSKAHDALFSVKNGFLLFVKRGEGKSFSGLGLPQVVISSVTQLLHYSANAKDRPRHGKTKAHWHDYTKGQIQIEEAGGGGQGPEFTLRHLYPNKDLAKAAAEAKLGELKRAQGSCEIEITGNAGVEAEGDLVIAVGRSVLDGVWTIKSVDHHLNDDGFKTSIHCEAKDGKESGSDGGGD